MNLNNNDNQNNNNIVLTGGGTMGHISPNIAIIPELLNYFNNIFYIGSKKGLEREKIESLMTKINKEQQKLYYIPISSTKLDRGNIIKNIFLPIILVKAIYQAKKIIKKIKPKVIFSKGGYVSVPVVLAGKSIKTPIVIHESDLTSGLANRIASKYATTVCTTFPETAKSYKNGVWTGSPINSELLLSDPNTVTNKLNFAIKRTTILITGGSQGSIIINNEIERILEELIKTYNIIHITGKNKKINYRNPNYYQTEFTSEIGAFFKNADIVISRAGSNTIFELALLKIPMILIPLSKKASRGDQIDNANYFAKLGIAKIVNEDNITTLNTTLQSMLHEREQYLENLKKINFSNGKDDLIKEILKAKNKKE